MAYQQLQAVTGRKIKPNRTAFLAGGATQLPGIISAQRQEDIQREADQYSRMDSDRNYQLSRDQMSQAASDAKKARNTSYVDIGVGSVAPILSNKFFSGEAAETAGKAAGRLSSPGISAGLDPTVQGVEKTAGGSFLGKAAPLAGAAAGGYLGKKYGPFGSDTANTVLGAGVGAVAADWLAGGQLASNIGSVATNVGSSLWSGVTNILSKIKFW